MTHEEFNNTGWTGGMRAIYKDKVYDIANCDFERKTIGLLIDGGIKELHHSEVNIEPYVTRRDIGKEVEFSEDTDFKRINIDILKDMYLVDGELRYFCSMGSWSYCRPIQKEKQ